MERDQGMQGGMDASSDDVARGGMGAGLGDGPGGALLGDVDGVINALQGGITAVPLESAAGLVGRIQGALQGLGAPGVHEVAQSLGTLQQSLVTQRFDDVGGLLARLAAQVMDVAEQHPGMLRNRLRTLSGLLTSASEQVR